jgi:lipid-A-disaccharide synthase-like uncharacterized protein
LTTPRRYQGIRSAPRTYRRCTVAERSVSWIGIVVLLTVIVLLTAFVLVGIWNFWPEVAAAAETAADAATESTDQGQGSAGDVPEGRTRVWLFSSFLVSLEVQLLVLAALAGAFGSLLHALRSLSQYIGNRRLMRSWVPFCVLLPFVGAVLGTILCLLFRGGLFSGEASAVSVNKFGMPAVAALAGLFTSQALEKVKKIGEAVFERVPDREDALEGGKPDKGDGDAGGDPSDSERAKE